MQKTAFDMRISDWSSDLCSSDLIAAPGKHSCGKPAPATSSRLKPLLQGRAGGGGGVSRSLHDQQRVGIGRAACRESGCQYVEIEVVEGGVKKETDYIH